MPASSPSAPESVRHVPVMLTEVLAALDLRGGETVIDGTFGAGGYTREILAAADTAVIAIDRDPDAVAGGMALVEAAGGRLTLVEDRFSNLDEVARSLGHDKVEGVVLDIGVSSMQLDEAERGFSFRREGPLDMRMEGRGPSAADLVATLSEADLARLFRTLGEERRAAALARAIVADRDARPFRTTRDLADLCARVIRSKPGEIHPATRAFQALRIAVNQELDELARALLGAERVLASGGRLVVVTFHSLEDRIVKTFLADRSRRSAGGSRHLPESVLPPPTFEVAREGLVTASEREAAANPRARSAKLRSARRTASPPRDTGIAFLGIPHAAAPIGRTR
jgi:16S rRNA (cytosine1402-N4)-methyltransferase